MPASSANLGPGFDVLAAALSLHLDVVVQPADEFELRTALPLPRDRSNLLVRAFETLRPADRHSFTVSSDIPLSGGLGSSAAAVVAGLLAADFLSGGDGDVLAAATAIEGHPDNVAAALAGGFVLCAGGAAVPLAAPPAGLTGVLVVPHEPVATSRARAALPDVVPLPDAVFNVAAASLLTLGLARSDAELIARGLGDRLHQPHRAPLYPRSAALMARATDFGALGATISGAGPTVLVWCRDRDVAGVSERLRAEADGWADVLPVSFEGRGAEVSESSGSR